MKTFGLFFIVLLVGALAWTPAQPLDAAGSPPDTLQLANPEPNDTLEYELLIFDARFETWFQRNRQPMDFYHEGYLENWNEQLARQWNALIPGTRRPQCIPETYLNYDPTADYGKELNYRLFYYFRYVHEQCRPFSHVPSRW
jgi:hypothetical protein